MNPLDLYNDGRRYDALFHGSHDIAFFREEANKSGGPVLELGCGTGRLLLPLLEDGHECSGVDYSASMIEIAREKIANAGYQAKLTIADAASFYSEHPFQTIFIANNSLGHFLTIASLLRLFERVRNNLDNGGWFLIDVFVPALHLLMNGKDEVPIMGYTDPESGGQVELWERYQYNIATQVKTANWRSVCEGKTIREEIFTIRMFFPQELDALVQLSGFEILAKYGNYDRSPFDDGSQRQLIIARRQP